MRRSLRRAHGGRTRRGRGPFGRGVAGQSANLAFQTGVDTSGEAVAQWWSTGGITAPGEVLLEGVGGLVTSPVELATAGIEAADAVWTAPAPVLGDPVTVHLLTHPTPGTRPRHEVDAANRAVLDGRLGEPAPLSEALIQRLPGWDVPRNQRSLRARGFTSGRRARPGDHHGWNSVVLGGARLRGPAHQPDHARHRSQGSLGRGPVRASADRPSTTPIVAKYGDYRDTRLEVLEVFQEDTCEGVGVDLEAFFQSREAFVDAYASYHE